MAAASFACGTLAVTAKYSAISTYSDVNEIWRLGFFLAPVASSLYEECGLPIKQDRPHAVKTTKRLDFTAAAQMSTHRQTARLLGHSSQCLTQLALTPPHVTPFVKKDILLWLVLFFKACTACNTTYSCCIRVIHWRMLC